MEGTCALVFFKLMTVAWAGDFTYHVHLKRLPGLTTVLRMNRKDNKYVLTHNRYDIEMESNRCHYRNRIQ